MTSVTPALTLFVAVKMRFKIAPGPERDGTATRLGGRGWTEPAKEAPVRSPSKVPIQVKRTDHVPGFHSFVAPTPATPIAA